MSIDVKKLSEALGTTPNKARLLVIGLCGAISAVLVGGALVIGGMTLREATLSTMVGWYFGACMAAPAAYDMVCDSLKLTK